MPRGIDHGQGWHTPLAFVGASIDAGVVDPGYVQRATLGPEQRETAKSLNSKPALSAILDVILHQQ
jgi:hypothetical protein